MDSFATGRMVGVLVGLLVGVVIAIVLLIISNKNHTVKSEYDERQKMVRGTGYSLGFWSMVAVAVLQSFLEMAGVELPFDAPVVPFLGVFVGLIVSCVYCVMKDAYWGLNNNRPRYIIIFLLSGAANLMLPIMAAMRGELMVDGKLTIFFVNLLCSLLLICVGIALVIKNILDGRDEEE